MTAAKQSNARARAHDAPRAAFAGCYSERALKGHQAPTPKCNFGNRRSRAPQPSGGTKTGPPPGIPGSRKGLPEALAAVPEPPTAAPAAPAAAPEAPLAALGGPSKQTSTV